MYLVSHIKSECCGCTACEQVCHARAITMQSDSEGFLYPIKDIKKCNECGLCEKICPVEHPLYHNAETPEVYAAYNKNKEERKKVLVADCFI